MSAIDLDGSWIHPARLAQIAQSGLTYVEVPVTIEYSAYSLAKGQKLSDAVERLAPLFRKRPVTPPDGGPATPAG